MCFIEEKQVEKHSSCVSRMKASKKNTYNYKMENSMADIVRKHIIFHGSVQGVGFRYYSEHKANQLRLTGWVKNLYNGDVEMEVQGSQAAIDELVAFLAGRRFVQITGMDVKKLDVVEEERKFGID